MRLTRSQLRCMLDEASRGSSVYDDPRLETVIRQLDKIARDHNYSYDDLLKMLEGEALGALAHGKSQSRWGSRRGS